jgi:hypothetical protein
MRIIYTGSSEPQTTLKISTIFHKCSDKKGKAIPVTGRKGP